jgi:hypothetical protein
MRNVADDYVGRSIERSEIKCNSTTHRNTMWAAVLVLFACTVAHADGVTTCTKASAVNTNIMNCLDKLVYQPLPVATTTLVLVCPSGTAGLQDQSQCPGNVWRPLSTTTPSTLIGYCAQTLLTPYSACDYPSGKEGYRLSSAIFGAPVLPAPPPTPPTPPTITGPATLSWAAPSLNTDGTPATIIGYRIEYGHTDFSQSVTTTATTYVFTLSSGSWQFRLIALSPAAESAPSATVTVNIQVVTPPVVPPPVLNWVVAPNGSSSTRPIYEAVLPATGSALVRGNQDGTIAVGKLCSSELFQLSGSSYRTIQNSDAALTSPTYQSRAHVAICVQQ